MSENGIKHILCRINRPQGNGKIGRWIDIYKVYRQGVLLLGLSPICTTTTTWKSKSERDGDARTGVLNALGWKDCCSTASLMTSQSTIKSLEHLSVSAFANSVDIQRHFFGHTSVHWAHLMHCATNILIFFLSGRNSMAWAGQTFMHN